MIERIFLGLGSNLDDSVAQITTAFEHLRSHAELDDLVLSPLYASPPMGPQDQPDFVNAALQLNTSISPEALLKTCKSIENIMGRQPAAHWGPRLIDIDILLYGDQIMETENLNIPHSGMRDRSFVLYPLADLDKALEVPGMGTLASMIEALGTSDIRQL